MDQPLEIAIKDIPKTDDIIGLINEKVEKLHQVHNNINSCRVAVEKPQKHQKTGSPYRVRLEIRIPPGKEIIVKREPGEGDMHEELGTVIRDVFSSGWRKLKEVSEKQRANVKRHPDQEIDATVVHVNKEDGFGFLASTTGHRIYFHKNAVTNDDFDRLEMGTGVRYVERMGDEGPQASTVHVIDKPGVREGKK